MAWSVDDEISALNLNLFNRNLASHNFSHSDVSTSETDDYHFYLHDCGNPTVAIDASYYDIHVIQIAVSASTSTYWFKVYGPDIKVYLEKRDNNGVSLGTHVYCDFDDENFYKQFSTSYQDLIDWFGSIEGNYILNTHYGKADRGGGSVQSVVYGYPHNCKADLPIRRYISPETDGYLTEDIDTLLSAANLNNHMFGTY